MCVENSRKFRPKMKPTLRNSMLQKREIHWEFHYEEMVNSEIFECLLHHVIIVGQLKSQKFQLQYKSENYKKKIQK